MVDALQKIAIILGGGITPDGKLTQLSIQRLDAAVHLHQIQKANMVLVLGGLKSTYLPNSIAFEETGASKRAAYLMQHHIPDKDILKVEAGRDTIGEALACRDFLKGQPYQDIILITSGKHMPRAAWVFRHVLGSDYTLENYGVDCGGILLADEEKEYLEITQNYLNGKDLNMNADDWHAAHPELYSMFKAIHDKYHPKGKESQAYFAVTDNPRNEI